MARMPSALAKAKLPAKMLLQVHDELVFECPKAAADESAIVVADVMAKAPLPAIELSVPLVVEARAGRNWDEAH
jgi:DNA polymerase-1